MTKNKEANTADKGCGSWCLKVSRGFGDSVTGGSQMELLYDQKGFFFF